ncbi:AMP-dependent synthetase/ligase [Aeoliella sp. SH292]|uniref:AMP-dependent synthetase/ligase n=1 Tax=Aeoliella sp. SH292 TaxID=3454464 RepID=UPI003F9A2F33
MSATTATSAQTLPELFVATVRTHRHERALGFIVDNAVKWHTWEELAAAVESRAREFADKGIVRGDLIVQIGPNSVEWVVNDMAMHYIGAVHVPLHASLSKAKLKELVAHCGAKHVIELGKDCNKIKLGKRSFERIGKESPPHAICGPESLATILYTSGTTGGEPRGVMLTQANIVSNTLALSEAVGSRNELRLSLLPFSHIYARTCDLYSWIQRGSRLVLAENPRETFMRDCQIVRPLVINAVPYLYQKLVDLADAELEQAVNAKPGDAPPKTLRQLLGGRVSRCYCGGAALAPSVVERFAEEQIPLLPGYGLTEASPVVTVPNHQEFSPSTVGRPLANLDVRLADDGEILVRGPSVMKGYWLNETATDEVLKDGWLHTGDLGEWDAEGRLSIVGRKKELMALATGKKIVPSAIETLICASPWIEQAMVIGEGRSYLSAIIVPNPKRIKSEIRKQKLFVWSKKRGVSHPRIRKIIEREINAMLAQQPAQQQVKKFVVIERGFSIDLGEMTPKLSLRRSVIEHNFAKEIAGLYS